MAKTAREFAILCLIMLFINTSNTMNNSWCIPDLVIKSKGILKNVTHLRMRTTGEITRIIESEYFSFNEVCEINQSELIS